MPCSWGVKAGKVREWVAGVMPLLSRAISERFSNGSSHNRVLYKCPITLLYLLCFTGSKVTYVTIYFLTWYYMLLMLKTDHQFNTSV